MVTCARHVAMASESRCQYFSKSHDTAARCTIIAPPSSLDWNSCFRCILRSIEDFNNSRIFKCLVHQAKRFRPISSETSGNFGDSRDFGKSRVCLLRMGVYITRRFQWRVNLLHCESMRHNSDEWNTRGKELTHCCKCQLSSASVWDARPLQ